MDGLRRLTGTVVTLRHWKERRYPADFPLIEVARLEGSRFRIKLSDWLSDELMDGHVLGAAPETSRLHGLRFRLYGWACSWVGRHPGTGEQIITMRDALARIGALPERIQGSACEQIVSAVEANDLPGFNVRLIDHRGQPAIRVEERLAAPTAPAAARMNEISLEGDWSEALEPPPLPREITL